MEKDTLISALRDVADLINSGQDAEETLRQLIVAACRHASWLRGSIMCIDLASGYAEVTVRYDPTVPVDRIQDRWVLGTSPSLVALQNNEPVFISDAKLADEFPGFQSEARQRGYSSVLVMPMSTVDQLGRPMVLTINSREVRVLSPADLAFMELVVHLGTIALEKQKALAQQRNSTVERQAILATHTRLMQQAISDGSVERLADAIQAAMRNAVVVLDLTTDAAIAGNSPLPDIEDACWAGIVETRLSSVLRNLAIRNPPRGELASDEIDISFGVDKWTLPTRTQPLYIDGKLVGALVVIGETSMSEIDRLLLESAGLALSVQLMRNMIRLQFEQRTLDELFLEIVSGRSKDVESLRLRASRFGVRLDRANRMILVSLSDNDLSRADLLERVQRSLLLLAERVEKTFSVISHTGTIAIVCQEGAEDGRASFRPLMNAIIQNVRSSSGVAPSVVLTSTCKALADYAAEWTSGLRILALAHRFSRTGIIEPEGLGALSILLSTANQQELRAFIARTVERIRSHDRQKGSNFYETLHAFVQSGYRHQACARALDVHVTTLRYRLARLGELFDIDIENSASRFEIELAIRMADLVSAVAARQEESDAI